MGRMTKQGIDYFSLDVQFDSKTELYILERGAVGLAVYVTLLQIIYQNEGYYIIADKDLPLLIKKRIGADIAEVNDCINSMLERGIFDLSLYQKAGILTSTGIQKRYFEASKKKKEVRVNKDFLLIKIDSCGNAVYVGINAKDVGINATKEKEKVKVKEKEKVKEINKEKKLDDVVDDDKIQNLFITCFSKNPNLADKQTAENLIKEFEFEPVKSAFYKARETIGDKINLAYIRGILINTKNGIVKNGNGKNSESRTNKSSVIARAEYEFNREDYEESARILKEFELSRRG